MVVEAVALNHLWLLLALVILAAPYGPVEAHGLPPAAHVIVVPHDYPDIARAATSAAPGTVIVVEPGVYAGPVAIYDAHNITIRGRGAVINGSLKIAFSKGVVVEGIRVRGRGDAVYIHGSQGIVLRDIAVEAGGDGILVYRSSGVAVEHVAAKAMHPLVVDSSVNVSVNDAVFIGGRNTVVIYKSLGVAVAGGEVRGRSGVAVRAGSTATLRDLRIAVEEHGVYVDASSVVLTGCSVEGAEYGVAAPSVFGRGGAAAAAYRVYINGSFFRGNTYGVYAAPGPLRLVIEGSVFRDNTYGVYAEEVADTYIGDSVFRGNRYGVVLRYFIGSYVSYPSSAYYVQGLDAAVDTGRYGYKTDPFPKYVNYWLRTVKGVVFENNYIGLSLEDAMAYVANNVFRNNTFAVSLRSAWGSMVMLNVFTGNGAVAAPGSDTVFYSHYPVPYALHGRYYFRPLGNYYGGGGVDRDGDGVLDRPARLMGVNGTVFYDPAALTEPPENYMYPVLFGNTTVAAVEDIYVNPVTREGYGEILVYYSGYGAEEIEVVLEGSRGTVLGIEGLSPAPSPSGLSYHIVLGKVGLYVFYVRVVVLGGGNHTLNIVVKGGGTPLYYGMINVWGEGEGGAGVPEGYGRVSHVFDPIGPAPYILFVFLSLAVVYKHIRSGRELSAAATP